MQEKSAYIWASTENFYIGEQSIDWGNGYQRILNANIVLEGIEKVQPVNAEQQDWNNIKGSALFYRAFDFFNLAQEYCRDYKSNTANTDLGLPLRLEYDVNIKVKRSNLQQTYERITTDLLTAADLLSTKPQYKTRPSKEAAYALLARVYLVMENYEQAGIYANKALQIQQDLLDYSKLSTTASFPLTRFNTEVIYHSVFNYAILLPTRLIVEPTLYNTYDLNDCRRNLFFTNGTNGITYKGSYNGDRNMFGGLATDEMYLIRAEAKARNGELPAALIDLNHLLRSRWKGNYQDLQSTDANVVLGYILRERRKELLFRGIRWADLRRLNKDSRFATVLSRNLNGTTYTLQPNDKKYVFPIDEDEIRLSGIQQNER
uniref:RagB/SusD family nutrient uptake outer membrane protein n=1 Tax=Pedobacter schmidteae TaxID=2201271 RepID=UPI000EB324BE|nr:RagB/SusD family nutrient uptake outer membrane protein [Pedobacter schmidteae]